MYLREILGHLLGAEILVPTDLYVDNKGAIDLANDYLSNSRVRHFSRRHLKIRELVQESIVAVKPIKTANNLSDIFTKGVTSEVLTRLLPRLGRDYQGRRRTDL